MMGTKRKTLSTIQSSQAPASWDGQSSHELTARLQMPPNTEHESESYGDLNGLEYPHALYSAMEQYLPPQLLSSPRQEKVAYIEKVLTKYRPDGERTRKYRDYRERIRQSYKPLHNELYTLDAESFLSQSFLDAISGGTSDAFREILTDHAPGLYTFEMLNPGVCAMLLEEVEHFEKWATSAKVKIMRPNTMNNHGAVLDDLGMDGMLNELMRKFISPMAASIYNNSRIIS